MIDPVRRDRVDVTGLVEHLPIAALVVDSDDVVVAANARAEAIVPGLARAAQDRNSPWPGLRPLRGLEPAVRDARSTGRPALLHLAVEREGPEPSRELEAGVCPFPALPGRPVLVTLTDRSEAASLAAENAVLRDQAAAAAAGVDAAHEELHVSNEELVATMEELQQRVRELEAAREADRTKTEFLAMLAHELRNPLAPVLHAAEIVRRHAGAVPAVARACAILVRQVQHQARLLDDLLDVSRITRGAIALRRRRLDLRLVAREVLDGLAEVIAARHQHLSVDLPDEAVVVDGDETRLAQVLTNLMHNAVKFTPPGGAIRVSVAADGGEAVLRVRDTGRGIAPERLESVFDLFEQIEPRPHEERAGLGVGLTLVRSLIELHGGRVRAFSEGRERGSEFVVVLPRVPGVVEDLPRQPPSAVTRRRILLVEDNPDARQALAMVLEADGHQVEAVGTGWDAVDAARARPADVVLIDLGLPDLDGYQLAGRLREALGSGVRLVAVTGYGAPEDVSRALAAGFDLHLAKPVDAADLARALEVAPP
jgi:signal transduction histidine kinase/CheY-like chemotaxis protein